MLRFLIYVKYYAIKKGRKDINVNISIYVFLERFIEIISFIILKLTKCLFLVICSLT